MPILKKLKIIGLSLIFLLTMQGVPAYAIYSPTLNAEAGLIKQHLRKSREQNGVGTLQNAWDKVSQKNLALKSEGKAYGTPGLFKTFVGNVKNLTLNSLSALKEAGITSGFSFVDSLFLITVNVVGPFRTNTTCWRDDVWALQALQEEVINELYKAGLLNDSINGTILWEDYRKLDFFIKDLKNDYRNTALWFNAGQQNYYLECPYGEFTQAWQNLSRSFDHLTTVFSGQTAGDWGSLYAAAEKNAKRKAAKWVKENKVGLTFGGPQGANPRSLGKTPGFGGLAKELTSGWELSQKAIGEKFEKMIELAVQGVKEETAVLRELGSEYFVEIYKATYEPFAGEGRKDLDEIIDLHRKVQKERTIAEDEAIRQINFNLQFSDIAENSLIDVERTLSLINQQIIFTSSNSALKACEKINLILKHVAKKKNPEQVNCKE